MNRLMGSRQLQYRLLGEMEYLPVWQAMKSFTDSRDAQTLDECWVVEHPSVFTLGQAGKDVHILKDIGVPIVKTDRGGQVTYHGPGQVVIYALMDLRRKKIGVRDLVTGIETSIVRLLEHYGIVAEARREAPGVYVAGDKIAALGLRVRKGCSFHGLSLNVDMDLSPFNAINPCGYEGLGVTQMKDHGVTSRNSDVALELLNELTSTFGYDRLIESPDTALTQLTLNPLARH